MPLFFSAEELSSWRGREGCGPAASLLSALRERVIARASSPGLTGRHSSVSWWHCAAEHLTDAAGLQSIEPTPAVSHWLRSAALEIARLDEQAWVGPPFRDHSLQPAVGNLETAHLSWALAVVLDLAPAAFSEREQAELREALRERAIPLCLRWLDRNRSVSNWRCVLTAGVAVAAAVLDDDRAIIAAAHHYRVAAQCFQADGSYGESLQYANYAAFHLMLSWEALVRRRPAIATELPLLPHGKFVHWAACSLFYLKPLGGGWGTTPRPRSANFGDSAAIFRPSADLLLHIARRTATLAPATAGLARWLFDTLYEGQLRSEPWDRASFGFVNHFGFLSLPLSTGATGPLTPTQAGLSTTAPFDNGDVLLRDAWDGSTTLAIRTGGRAALFCSGHLHGDINSFILAHRNERLLVDPGHSCYRGLVHEIEVGSRCHNTCTFLPKASSFGLQEEVTTSLQQAAPPRRLLDGQMQPLPEVQRATRMRLCAREGDVSVVVSDAAAAYRSNVREFTRLWMLAGPNVLFIVDFIVTSIPVQTTWHWVLNNRDGELALELTGANRFTMRRGDVGLAFLHAGPARIAPTVHGFVHDAYHPEVGQLGEGASGSGRIVQLREPGAATERTAINALVFADSSGLSSCTVSADEDYVQVRDPRWTWHLHVAPGSRRVSLHRDDGKRWTIGPGPDQDWVLS